jgi:two-component system chemotaxis response regulator CheB
MAAPTATLPVDSAGASARIGVLVVEADADVQRLLCALLEADPRIRVVQAVADGAQALDFLRRSRPHVVLMGWQIAGMDGCETARRIMENTPLPIVLYAAADTVDPLRARALEAGAVACVERPVAASAPAVAAHLRQTVMLMSEVKVVRRWARTAPGRRGPAAANGSDAGPGPAPARLAHRLVGIGASTGGPPVLQTVLAGLPPDFGMPVLVVQHIARGFLPNMVEWLRQTSGPRVCIAAHGMQPQPGCVYLAPDDFQMSVDSRGLIVLGKDGAPNELRPSVARLFRSLAESCGAEAVGVLLTGMGRDGAAELKLMKDRGAVTIAQDSDTSIVHGMPGTAIALGGATHVLPAQRIADTLISLADPHPRTQRT